jgi:hypothetical protein
MDLNNPARQRRIDDIIASLPDHDRAKAIRFLATLDRAVEQQQRFDAEVGALRKSPMIYEQTKTGPFPDHWIRLKREGADFGINHPIRGAEIVWDRDQDVTLSTSPN